MPTYEYKCDKCERIFESHRSVEQRNDFHLTPCGEECGGTLHRSVGCAGFQLKGFCWSKDNYSRTIGDDPRGVEDTNWDMNHA